ncbi:MAG: bacterial Ig-like domain-containing protein [Acutalibacteraceae bacterium]|nr:bacterial Ig-like domain-containing protein [Acutalibacteraceae bacterium]
MAFLKNQGGFMMKTFFSKITAALLVVMMLFSIVPVMGLELSSQAAEKVTFSLNLADETSTQVVLTVKLDSGSFGAVDFGVTYNAAKVKKCTKIVGNTDIALEGAQQYYAPTGLYSAAIEPVYGKAGSVLATYTFEKVSGKNITKDDFALKVSNCDDANGEKASVTVRNNIPTEKPAEPVKTVLTGIALTSNPSKTTYTVGDTLSTSGMVVQATYSDGSKKNVTGYTCSPTKLSTEGSQNITVSYTEGEITKTASFLVTVNKKAENPIKKELEGIILTSKPSKITYTVGDTLSTSGMVVQATYSDGSKKNVTGYTCSPTKLSTEGSQKVTVSYTDGSITKTALFLVTVNKKAESPANPIEKPTPTPTTPTTPTTVPSSTEATTVPALSSGKCGDNAEWFFDETTGTLIISGSGDMWDYAAVEPEWVTKHGIYIKEVTISYGITSIGAGSFKNCLNLETVYIPSSVVKIGAGAFDGCYNLKNVYYEGEEEDFRNLFPQAESIFGSAANFNFDSSVVVDSNKYEDMTTSENDNEPATIFDKLNIEKNTLIIIIAVIVLLIIVVAVLIVLKSKKKKAPAKEQEVTAEEKPFQYQDPNQFQAPDQFKYVDPFQQYQNQNNDQNDQK